MSMNRRDFIAASGLTAAALTTLPYFQAKARSEDVLPLDVPPQTAGEPDKDYMPTVTPNGRTLPYTIVEGVKVFHLVAQEVLHEFSTGLKALCWSYNDGVHGPTI